ncbi:hypothetical protein [Streptomyces sp. NPDC097610]
MITLRFALDEALAVADQLIRARRDGHTALFLEMDGDTVAMSTGR